MRVRWGGEAARVGARFLDRTTGLSAALAGFQHQTMIFVCGFAQLPGFAQDAFKNFVGGGLTKRGEPYIFVNGSRVAEPSRGVTVGSKKRLPSVRSSEGRK